ncbi:MAG TPA: hypothetical protein VNA19_11050, partial [Pyrinomonadaceae bacterium]|nr:hypothetical protein [Pyrinomonadaceae bacterium]
MENTRDDDLSVEHDGGAAAQAEGEGGEGSRKGAAFGEWVRARGLYLLGGLALIASVFGWLQFSTGSICCGDYDGYYHVKWSRMLWEGMRSGQFPPLFTVLPLTTLNPQDYVDHHFLFHVLQIPFTWFRDTTLGAKVGTLIFSTLAVFSCYWLVVRYRLRYPLMWLLALLACSAPFLYRMNMAKAMSVSIVLLIAGIYLLFERRYRLLAPLAFLFALTYDMFVLLCVAAFVWAFVVWWNERRIEWQPVALAVAGSIAGFIINPYFPRNIRLFVEHLMMKVTTGGFSTEVGGEWYPYNSWEFLMNCFAAFIATLAGYIAFNNSDRRNSRAFFFLIFSTILLVANAKWKRFSEYWPPFAILFAAFSLQNLLSGARSAAAQLPDEVLDELQPYFDRHEHPATIARERGERWREYALVGVVVLYLCFQTAGNFTVTARDIEGSAAPNHYKAATDWLHANVPKGEMIFNTDWDDFPRLFYFASEYTYVSGLDPTYLHDKNPKLSELYKRITVGDEDDPGPIIRQSFGARYVFSDNEHEDFYNKALDSGWFDEVYVDDDATILRIRDTKGEPPPIPED